MAQCCKSGIKLTEEYENALKFEAIAYGRLIAHKRRHEDVGEIPRVRHMRMVIQAAKDYTDGNAEALGEVPSADDEIADHRGIARP